MVKLEINGKIIEVDDSFLSLPKAQQDATVDEIAQSIAASQQVAPEQQYSQALEKIRVSQFPDMSPEAFADYSSKALAPYGGRDLAQNAQTMGFGDEINAGLGAFGSQVRQWTGGGGPGFGEAYDQYKALEEARRDYGKEQLGGLGVAAEVAGGLSTFGAGAAVPKAASLLVDAGKGLVSGAVLGGVYGYGAADENRAQEAVKSALLGGAVGAAAPVVVKGASAAYENVANRFAQNNAARQMGISPEASRMLQETLAADDSLSSAGLARMNAAGNEQMLADAGPSARNFLDYAIQSSGNAGQVARGAIAPRVERDAAAIQDAMDMALGQPQGVNSLRSRIAQESSGARSSAYDAAYNAPIDYSTPEGLSLQNILSTRVDPSAITAANNLMRAEGVKSSQILAKIADDGSVIYETLPDTRQIDYITRALNDRAQSNAGLGVMGGQTNEGRIYQGLSRDLRGGLKDANPLYADALEVAADPLGRSQAVKFGAEMFRPNVTREQVAEQVSRMSGPEKEAVASGLRQNVDDALSRVTRSVQDGDIEAREAIAALKQFSSRANREKAELVIGKDKAKILFDELDRASNSFNLRAAVADNSATFRRQEMQRRTNEYTSPDNPVSALLRGEPVNAGKRVIQAFTGQTPDVALRKQDQILSEVVKALTQPGAKAVSNQQALRFLAGQSGANQAVVGALLANGRRASGPAGYLAAQQGSGL